MKVPAHNPLALQVSGNRVSDHVEIDARDGWAERYTLGQIIKGRVLRQLSAERYEVSFNGDIRIVGSAIRFEVGEELTGRVTHISDQIKLKRLESLTSTEVGKRELSSHTLGNGNPLEAMAERFQISLPPAQAELLKDIPGAKSGPDLALKLALLAVKLGVPLTKPLIAALTGYAEVGFKHDMNRVVGAAVPTIVSAKGRSNEKLPPQDGLLAQVSFAKWLSQMDEAVRLANEQSLFNEAAEDQAHPQHGAREGQQFSQGEEKFRWLYRLLNAQEDTSVSHRFQILPLMVNESLKEFELAIFEHDSPTEDGIQTRRLRFSLETEFGNLTVDVSVANEQASLHIATETQDLLRALQQHSGSLEERLDESGWRLSRLEYRVEAGTRPAELVVEHLLAHGSLMRVM